MRTIVRRHEEPGVPDAENPEVTPAEWRRMRPLKDVLTERVGRGPQKAPTKRAISLRLDRDVLDMYKKTGRGWQGRMNEDLRKAAKRRTAAVGRG
jgi:uncharacterized protein (DUF4415 family)